MRVTSWSFLFNLKGEKTMNLQISSTKLVSQRQLAEQGVFAGAKEGRVELLEQKSDD